MAITFVAASNATTNNGSSVAPAVPTGVQDDDLLLAVVGHRMGSGGTITAPAGWTQLDQQRNSGTALGQAIFRKLASSESGTYTFEFGASGKGVAVVTAFRGVDQTTPVSASLGQVNASSTDIVHPALTSSGHAHRVILSGLAESAAINEVTGWTLDANATVTNGGGPSSSRNRLAVQHQAHSTDNPPSVTAVADTAAVNVGHQVALNEAAAGAPTAEGGSESTVQVTAEGAGEVVAVDLTVRLLSADGNTIIAALPLEGIADAYADQTINLTEVQADEIAEADYGTGLILELVANGTRAAQVSWAELEVPAGAEVVISGGSEATVSVSAEGAGQKLGTGSAESAVDVSAEGGGQKQASSASEATVEVSAEGTGRRATSGGAEAVVLVSAEGASVKHAFGGSEAAVSVVAEGAGDKLASGGSESGVVISAEGEGAVVTRVSVSAGADDGHVRRSDNFFFDDLQNIERGFRPGDETIRDAWFRFASVSLPPGAVINSAKLTHITSFGGDSGAVTIRIRAEAADNPAAPSSGADYHSRTRTTADVTWEPEDFVAGEYDTPDLKGIIQEVVDLPGWVSGNAIQIFEEYVSGSARRRTAGFTHADDPALLTVQWVSSAAIGGGSEATVTVTAEGTGTKAVSGGSEAGVTVSADGDGTASRSGSSEAAVQVVAEGAGSTARSSGAESTVHVTVEGDGTAEQPPLAGGSEATVSVSADGAGTKQVSGGSEAGVTVSADGSGTANRLGGAEADVQIVAEGSGTASRSGGSEATVHVSAEGAGTVEEPPVEGGSDATVHVSAESDGIKRAVGGSEAAVSASAEGEGTKTGQGGSDALVLVLVDGDGNRHAFGAAEAFVHVTATGGGFADAPGAPVIGPTTAQLVSNGRTEVVLVGSGTKAEVTAGG